MDQKSYEHSIGVGLCLQLGNGWRIVGQPDPPAPDLLLQSDKGETVGVELGRYRQQGRENEQHPGDSRFRHAVCDAWVADDAVNETSLHLSYAKSPDGRHRIPPPHSHLSVIQSLKAIVLDLRFGTGERSIEFSRGFPEVQALPCVPARFRSCLYPDVAEFFGKIDLHPHPGTRLGLPRTSLSMMRLQLDEAELRRVVKKKAGKVNAYRAARSAGSTWLVVHSDGYPLPANVPDLQLRRAHAVIAEEARGSGFDAVYWYAAALMHPSGGNLTRISLNDDDAADQ